MPKIESNEELAAGGRKELLETIIVLVEPFADIKECHHLLNKKASNSFNIAHKAYLTALESRKDVVLRVKALVAFQNCYSDLGLDNRAADMKNKWKALIHKHKSYIL